MTRIYESSHAELKKEEAKKSLETCYQSMNPLNDISIKRHYNYYDWIDNKSYLFKDERSFKIPFNVLPTKIDSNTYQWLRPDKKEIFNRYYSYNKSENNYLISVNRKNISYDDIEILVNTLIFKRKNVVWAEFGCNLGHEFGGKHPALILKKMKEALLVLPISSKEPNPNSKSVKIEHIYNFPNGERWVNLSRIKEISIIRVDYYSKIGNVNSKLMQEISEKLKESKIYV